MAEEGDNLATVLGAWLDATRAGALDPLEAIMDEDISWHGIVPGTVCHGRAETIETMRRGMETLPRITKMEAIEMGDVVVMSLTGPDFRYPDWEERPELERGRPQLFMRLTLRAGRVTEMRATGSREDALERI